MAKFSATNVKEITDTVLVGGGTDNISKNVKANPFFPQSKTVLVRSPASPRLQQNHSPHFAGVQHNTRISISGTQSRFFTTVPSSPRKSTVPSSPRQPTVPSSPRQPIHPAGLPPQVRSGMRIIRCFCLYYTKNLQVNRPRSSSFVAPSAFQVRTSFLRH